MDEQRRLDLLSRTWLGRASQRAKHDKKVEFTIGGPLDEPRDDHGRWTADGGTMTGGGIRTNEEASRERQAAAGGPGSGTGPESSRDDGGRRSELGGADRGSDRGPGSAGGRRPRIVTARANLVQPADPALVPESLRQHLNETQVQGAAAALRSLDANGGFLLSDGTGTGKTRQELAVAATYAARGKKVLIVTPAEVIKPDWKKNTVAGSFATDARAMGLKPVLTNGDGTLVPGQIQLTTYDKIGKLKDQVDANTIVIYDESHSLKNYSSSRSKYGAEISKAAGAVMYATATPADKPLHIAHLFRAKIFGERKWAETYKELGLQQVEVHAGVKQWQVDPHVGYPEVYRRMSGLFDRMIEDGLMLKREISLDGLQVTADRIELSPAAHAQMKQVFEDTLSRTNGNKAVALMATRMAQEVHKIPHAVKAVQEELAAGRSVVVFAARVNKTESGEEDEAGEDTGAEGTMKLLREQLEAAGVNPKEITELHGGKTKTALQKAKSMEAFQSGRARVMLATIESGGTGVNLDDTVGDRPRTTIVITPPFSAVSNVQMAGRTWRLNTKSDAKIRYLFANTDIDDWNTALIARKMHVHGAVVSGEAMRLQVPGAKDDEDELEIGGEHTSPYQWGPLVKTAGAADRQATSKQLTAPPVHITGDTYTHKDKIKAAGGRWDIANKLWAIPADKASKLRELSGLHFSDTPQPVAEPRATEPAVTRTPISTEPPPPYISDEQRHAIHQALRLLAANDPDRARERNGSGFNRMDSEFGANLSESDRLTDRQALAGAKLLAKYHRQVPAELLTRATTFAERPHTVDTLATEQMQAAVPPEKYVVSGNTYPHKDKIKAAGGRWDGGRGVWVIPAAARSKIDHLAGLRFS